MKRYTQAEIDALLAQLDSSVGSARRYNALATLNQDGESIIRQLSADLREARLRREETVAMCGQLQCELADAKRDDCSHCKCACKGCSDCMIRTSNKGLLRCTNLK